MAPYLDVVKFYWYFSNMVVPNISRPLTVQNVGMCARNCKDGNMNCNSFFFDTLDNTCMLYSGTVEDTDTRLVQQKGMHYFMNGKATSCWSRPGYKHGPGFCVKSVDSRLTWHHARGECRGQGGSLVKVDSQEKNMFLKSIYGNLGQWWVGGNDELVEGTWVWSDGPQISGFDDWKSGEPAASTHKNCMIMGTEGWFAWLCSGGGKKKVHL